MEDSAKKPARTQSRKPLAVINQNSMKYFPVILSVLFLTFCTRRNSSSLEKTFITKTYSVTIDKKVKNIIYYKNYFFCLDEDSHLVCLTKRFAIDREMTDSINTSKFENIFLSNDTLFAFNRLKNQVTDLHYLNGNEWQKSQSNIIDHPLYEDSLYIASSCCAGEFGGSLFFSDKFSKHVYSCPATCVTNVHRINGKYYITMSLAHSSGLSEVVRIDDPSKLFDLTSDSSNKTCNWWKEKEQFIEYYKRNERIEIGAERLWDSVGILTMTSFVYNNELYHLNCDRKKTFLSKTQGDSLFYVDSIYNKPLWSHYAENSKFGNINLSRFGNYHGESGFITIEEDTISIISFVP
jgi:hypothetical protein